MMDNLNLKPQSPDEVKTMMWTGKISVKCSICLLVARKLTIT